MNRAGARKENRVEAGSKTPFGRARPFKGHILPVGARPIRQELPRATVNVAERKRSRSEADTGRRTGFCFRLEFEARANSAIRRIAVLGESDTLAARGGRAEDEPGSLRR